MVYVGSARSDENGRANSGKAGDQKSGREVSKQAWYKHAKGWRVLRCVIPEMRDLIAEAMRKACDNNRIGYDQWQRLTLYKDVRAFNFDPSMTTKAVETDCSALVRVCVLYAMRKTGRSGDVPNFTTPTQAGVLLGTGLFEEMKGAKYTDQPDFLLAGDILVTKTQGHTVIVLDDGDLAGEESVSAGPNQPVARILKNGMEGADVKELQSMLIQLGYDLGKWGADGDFGDQTEMAVRAFQKDYSCEVDGQVGPETLGALNRAFNEKGDAQESVPDAKSVRIVDGDCYVRSAPNTAGAILGVAKEGTALVYQDMTAENSWHLVIWQGKNGWISGKYGKLEV